MSTARARLAVLGAAALALRLAVVAVTPTYRPLHDDASYVRVARWLLIAGHYPGHHLPGRGWEVSAYRPPGWPAALWATFRVFGQDILVARLLTAGLGAVAVVLVALLAGRLFGPRAEVATGALGVVSPLWLAVDATLESEALFIALVAAAACLALEVRRSGRPAPLVAAGVLAGLAALTRTNGLLVVPAIALLARPPGGDAARLAIPLVAATLVVAPWTVRNAHEVHAFVPVSTETGNTLAGVYNPVSLRHGARWLEPRRTGAYRAVYRRYGASAAGDAALTAAVGRWVARHPRAVAEVGAIDGARLLGLAGGPGWASFSLRTMSLGGAGGLVVWGGVLVLTLLAAAGAWLTRGRDVPGGVWLLAAALLVPAALINGELRLGAPAEIVLLPLAGAAAALVQAPVRRRRPAFRER
jgi:4-amino-4-deoxy-L-arabinose transferase-like glycosyltransferase